MAVATEQNRDRAVARPPWVRRHENQHEGVVAGIMLMLVIVGIVIFLFWVPLIRMIATAPVFGAATVPTDRPAEGAIPAGPPIVVSLDQPVVPSQASVDEGVAAQAATDAPPSVAATGDPGNSDPAGVAEPAPTALLGPNNDDATAPELGDSAAAEAAAARDAVETARAAEAARADNDPAPEIAVAPPATPTAAPAATATPQVAATSAAASSRRARVVGTGGRGVILYSAPRQGARMPAGILEGTVVSVLGTSGGEWTQVQGAGKTGWVRSEYLAPAN